MAMFRRWAGTLFISCPPISTVPALGESRPAISLSNEDLPHPEGPTMVTISRSRTSNDTSLKARKSFAKVLDTLCNWMDDMTGIYDQQRPPRGIAVLSLFAAAFRQRGRTGNCSGLGNPRCRPATAASAQHLVSTCRWRCCQRIIPRVSQDCGKSLVRHRQVVRRAPRI